MKPDTSAGGPSQKRLRMTDLESFVGSRDQMTNLESFVRSTDQMKHASVRVPHANRASE